MKKNFKYGITSTALFIGIVAVIVLINVFATLLVNKFPLKIDLTTTKMYEISDKTYEYLKTYEKPTTIYILSAETDEDKDVKNILEKYSQSSSNIKLENIDPATSPTFGKKYTDKGVSLSNVYLIIECGERFKMFSWTDLYGYSQNQQTYTSIKVEQQITSALKYVSSDSNFTVGFINGHGEDELIGARQTFETMSFEIVDINLASEEIPENVKMVVIAAPKNDYTTAEMAKLDKFFQNAGKAHFIFEPTVTGLNNLYDYIDDWGIRVNDDLTAEQSNVLFMGDMYMPTPVLADNDITNPISESQRYIAYMISKSLTPLFESNNGIVVTHLLSTSENSYTTTDFENGEINASSKKGASVIAATAVKQGDTPEQDAIIFVSGTPLLLDADRELVAYQYGFANNDFYSNVISYLQGSNDDYSISSKSIATERVTIESNDALIIGLIFVIILPIAVLVCGIVIWVKRRNL